MTETILNFKIDKTIKQKLQIISIKQNMNLSEYIRSIVFKHLETEKEISNDEKDLLKGELAQFKLKQIRDKQKQNLSEAFLIPSAINIIRKLFKIEADQIFIDEQIEGTIETIKELKHPEILFRKFLPYLKSKEQHKHIRTIKQLISTMTKQNK